MVAPVSDGPLIVDFTSLAITDPDFARVYTAHDGQVDFQDPETVQQLTRSILKRDFGLTLELPSDRLCPPVPVRYEYIRWIQSLLDTTSDEFTESYDADRDVVGIDIGVGASCIYPLIGCAARPKWRFGGTDIDEKNCEYATRNIAINKLQSRVRLRKTQHDGPLIPLSALSIKHADFIMCNPPFFTSKQDMLSTHLTKKRSPSAVCSGAEVEMITDGGDLGFVLRIVAESEKLRENVQWFSSMLGKLSSVNKVVARLKELGISNWAVTTFQAGNVTRRWAVAWSYSDLRPRNDVCRGDMTVKEALPFPTEYIIKLSASDAESSSSNIEAIMSELDVEWSWEHVNVGAICFAKKNVWSRAARRKRKREKNVPDTYLETSDDDDETPALGVRVSIAEKEVLIRWLQGYDSVLFESFCGMLKRELSRGVEGERVTT